ncbi:Protein gir2 [Diatrype stigma]|uniref:Protein gir2 n=1 Tax=Diatrype stigma TaxID=117547 RepID=A0AAN9YPD2_9PEZI
MGKEEQVEEREVLESIFPDEITDISETEFRITVTLELPEDDEQADTPPVMQLHVRYPEAYPDEAPTLDIVPPPQDQQQEPHPHFSLAEDKPRLLAQLAETAQENLGMAMVFALAMALKEAAEALVAERRGAAAAAHEEVRAAAEEEENRRFHGTAVTPESFARWRDAFLREMEDARVRAEEDRLAELKKARVKEPVKLTGRQLWERGLAGKGEVDEGEGEGEDDDGAAAGLEEGVDRLKVAA